MTTSLPLHYQPITTLQRRLRAGEISAVELVRHYIARCDALNDRLHAMITVAQEDALQQAERVDRRLREQDAVPPLAGIPLVVKDVIPVKGMPATYNSRIRRNADGSDWIPDNEPEAIALLRAAGAIILGKANNNEFLGIPSDQDRFPPPRSPYNPAYVSIGSSSGSGVAPAAGMCAASIGTDSAGSVRLPAGQHGLVGFKATNGRITRAGMGKHSTLQVMGPLARTTADAALIYEALTAGADPVTGDLQAGIRGWRIGVPWRYIETSPVEDEIVRSFRQALDQLAAQGAEIVDMRLAGMAEARMATFVVLYTEHHSSHVETLHRRYEAYGDSARLYAMQGAFISAIDYQNALEMGRRLTAVVDDAFAGLDAIAMPTSPFVTAEAARKPSEHRQGMNTVFTGPFNLTGHPAISVPCGVSETKLPISMQFVVRHHEEKRLFQLAHAYEQATAWGQLHPEL
jgi:aspartyl-tRNA(Asn)/glutamyl-tRNA(Gln) amidotransferase subunit A